MDLIIGGSYSGKFEYAMECLGNEGIYSKDTLLIDETNYDEYLAVGELYDKSNSYRAIIINHLHLIIRVCPEDRIREDIMSLIKDYEGRIVIICDEIGNGIIPLDKVDREYRDRLGAILIKLAKSADNVWRVMCKIPQKIK